MVLYNLTFVLRKDKIKMEHQDYPVYHKLQTHLMGVVTFIRQICNFIIKENTSPDITEGPLLL
jgi:hypothetical protein